MFCEREGGDTVFGQWYMKDFILDGMSAKLTGVGVRLEKRRD
jgi:hypothetical protein